ncbi:hypothetical protein Aduo_010251 [Ancylostoma duodenale]
MFIQLLLVILPILQPTISIKCWLWHHQGMPYELVDHKHENLKPQCYFHMDLPCFTRPVTLSARAGFDHEVKEHNICYVDKWYNSQVRCVCDTDECSTNCTQIVSMWKKSENYETEGIYANCMNQYIQDCFAGKIKQPVKGETRDNEKRW